MAMAPADRIAIPISFGFVTHNDWQYLLSIGTDPHTTHQLHSRTTLFLAESQSENPATSTALIIAPKNQACKVRIAR